jgi:hypothetical protein
MRQQSNATIKACPHCKYAKSFEFIDRRKPCTSINKRGRWKIVEAIQHHVERQNVNKKTATITVKGSKRYIQYKYLRKYLYSPIKYKPKHPFFAHKRPHFIYKPNVKYAKLNTNEFSLAWELGSKYFKRTQEEALFDESPRKTLVYLTGTRIHDKQAGDAIDLHMNGGTFASYCHYDHFNYGPYMQGELKRDKSIKDVITMHLKSETSKYCHCRNENKKYDAYKIEKRMTSKQRWKEQRARKIGINKDMLSYIDSNRY